MHVDNYTMKLIYVYRFAINYGRRRPAHRHIKVRRAVQLTDVILKITPVLFMNFNPLTSCLRFCCFDIVEFWDNIGLLYFLEQIFL